MEKKGTHDSWFVAAHYRPPNYKKTPQTSFFFTALSCESSFEAQDFKDAAQVKKVGVVHATW